ncbi:MAG: Holliday junction resolvase Hjc, partial [Fervidicoccaceae archaeon]
MARKLWSMGFACVRGPASGAKAKHVLQPDIVAIRNGRVLVIEVKTRRKSSTIYVEKEQIEKLEEWRRRIGESCVPLVAVYVGREMGWRFVTIDGLERTRSGNAKVTREALSRAHDLLSLKNLTDPHVSRIDSYRLQ